MEHVFDIAIIGSGPAGMTSAIYASRFNLSTLIFEFSAPGGAMTNTEVINNYPGYNSISGVDLSMAMYTQMTSNDDHLDYISEKVEKIEIVNFENKRIFKLTARLVYYAKTVVIATGTYNKTLGVLNEDKFFYKGISWCAICDGPLYKGRDVAVIGGGNSALSSAITLSKFARNVYIIHRRNEFRADNKLVENVKSIQNIHLIMNSQVLEFKGTDVIKSISYLNKNTNVQKELEISCVFESVGKVPNTELVKNIVNIDDNGYIIVDKDMKTNVEGLFACGDVISKDIRQIATAVNDGAIASICASKYITVR